MIPRRLIIDNIKSHEHTEIDFDALDIAAIIGRNGAGKTAIPDCMLLALFDRMPQTEWREVNFSDIIMTGAKEGAVTFYFTEKGQEYEVMRKKPAVKGRPSVSTLSQLVQGKWKPLADGKEVTPMVEKILGQNYETFTTISMIVQEHGDRLLTLQPRESFKLALELFGHAKYTAYEKNANRKKETMATKREAIESTVTEYRIQAESLPSHETALATAETQAAETAAVIAQRKNDLKDIYGKTAVITEEIRRAEQSGKKLDEAMKEIATMTARRSDLMTFLAITTDTMIEVNELYNSFLNNGGEKEALTRKVSTAAKIDEINSALTKRLSIKEQIDSYAKPIADLRKRIQQLTEIIARKEEILSASAKSSDISHDIAVLRTTREALQEDIADFNKTVQENNKIKAERARLANAVQNLETQRQAQLESLRKEIDRANDDAASLQNATCKGIGKYSKCPLIATAVSQRDALPQMKQRLEELDKRPQYPQDTLIAELDVKISTYSEEGTLAQIAQATSEAKEHANAITKKETEKKALDKTAALAQPLATAEADIASAEADIARYQSEIDEKTASMNELAKVEAGLPELQKQHDMLETVLSQFERKAEADAITTQIEAAEKSCEEIRADWLTLNAKKEAKKTLDEERTSLESALAQSEANNKATSNTITIEKMAIEQCKKAAATVVEKDREIAALEHQERIYTVIADACRKIPYIMIENILPMVQYEANNVLAAISDTDMRLELSTRETTATGEKDKLIIKAYDNVGTRPARLFSGGERTRLALALTLGIAEATAKRAGVMIETLGIDEPSWLDEEGFEQFGHCVQSLAQDRERVKKLLLITHSQILKEMFQQRIEVEKIAGKSIITVIS